MSVNLSPLGGAGWQFLDNNGNPLVGGLLYTYAAGTTTPQATYTTAAGNVANANPIVLDSAGRVANQMWLTAGVSYKLELKTSTGTSLWTKDNIDGINDVDASSVVVYVPAGAGAVPTTVQAKLRERISAFDFMTAAQVASVQARDMVEDVTVPLQAFFDACKGKKGYLPAGTYKKTAQIVMDPQYSYDIEGDGWSSEYTQQGSIIRDTTNSNGLFIYYSLANYPGGPPGGGYPNSDNMVRLAQFALRGPDSLTLSPGTQTVGIEGVNTVVSTGAGIWMYWMNHLRLEDVWIDGYVGDGVYGYRCFSAAFKNVWIIKNNLCGVHLYNTSNNVAFKDCKVLANGRVPRPDINCNILIDGASGYDNLGPNIDTGTDVSYAGQQGVRYSAKDGTLTSIVVSAGVATANITGTNRFSAGHKLAVNGWLPTSVTAGSFQVGAQYTIATLGNTDFTAIGASTNAVGIVFTATGAGTGTGTATVDLNTRGDAITVTSVTASTIVFPLAVPDGTYDQGALPQNQRTLAVAPYCAGVGIDRIQGCRIAGYSEENTGPGVYVFDNVDSFLVQGGYWLQDTIFVKSGARGGVIQGCAFSGVEAGVYLENPVSAVVGQNTYLTDPVRGSPLSYIGNLPFLDNGSMIVQGMTIGRGADFNIGRYEPGPVQSTAVGIGALVSANTSGGAGQGLQNTAMGYFALNANTSGYNNTAVGRHAGLALTTGYQNVAVGNRAMDTGANLQGCVFVGNTAGSGMTSGSNDTYVGIAAGVKATPAASDGNNTGLGSNALRVDGSQNYKWCTIVGAQDTPMSAAAGLTNYTGLGWNTWSFAATNKVRAGDANVTAAHVQVAWTATSDARLKKDITDLDLGLALVKALRPVSFKRINGDDTEELGFIAQEVESALPRPLGLLSVDNLGTYGLRKDDLIAVLVKAVQELSARVEELENNA